METIERYVLKIDDNRHELIELTSLIGILTDVLLCDSTKDEADIEAAVDALFVIRRGMIQVSDSLGKITESCKQEVSI